MLYLRIYLFVSYCIGLTFERQYIHMFYILYKNVCVYIYIYLYIYIYIYIY